MKHFHFFRISLFSKNSDYFCDLGFSQIQETNYFVLKMLTLSVNKCCDFGTEKCFCFIRILIDFDFVETCFVERYWPLFRSFLDFVLKNVAFFNTFFSWRFFLISWWLLHHKFYLKKLRVLTNLVSMRLRWSKSS